MRLLLAILVALIVAPAALAKKEPAPLEARAPASGAAARALLPAVFGDGLVAGADFSLDLGQHAGARVIYYDAGARFLFHDRTISKVAWGSNSVTIVGIGTLNGKPVKFTLLAIDGGDTSNGIFKLSVNGGVPRGGTVSEGSVTIG